MVTVITDCLNPDNALHRKSLAGKGKGRGRGDRIPVFAPRFVSVSVVPR